MLAILQRSSRFLPECYFCRRASQRLDSTCFRRYVDRWTVCNIDAGRVANVHIGSPARQRALLHGWFRFRLLLPQVSRSKAKGASLRNPPDKTTESAQPKLTGPGGHDLEYCSI